MSGDVYRRDLLVVTLVTTAMLGALAAIAIGGGMPRFGPPPPVDRPLSTAESASGQDQADGESSGAATMGLICMGPDSPIDLSTTVLGTGFPPGATVAARVQVQRKGGTWKRSWQNSTTIGADGDLLLENDDPFLAPDNGPYILTLLSLTQDGEPVALDDDATEEYDCGDPKPFPDEPTTKAILACHPKGKIQVVVEGTKFEAGDEVRIKIKVRRLAGSWSKTVQGRATADQFGDWTYHTKTINAPSGTLAYNVDVRDLHSDQLHSGGKDTQPC